MTQRTPQQVLDAALSYLEEHGWARDASLIAPNGRCCPLVAIGRVVVTTAELEAAFQLLRSRLNGSTIVEWSDSIAKDFSEVRAVMKGEQR